MVQAALRSGTAARRAVFEVFARRLPRGRRYGVVGGTRRLLEAIERFRFDEAALAFLADHGIVDQETRAWLADYRFSGDIDGYTPRASATSRFAAAGGGCDLRRRGVLETLVLSVLNYDSAIAAPRRG